MRKLFFIVALSLISTSSYAQMFSKTTQQHEESCRTTRYASGCDRAGIGYEKGDGVRQDYKKAAEMYKIGCDRNGLSSCTRLADLYAKGKGVPKNIDYAIDLHMETCARSTDQTNTGGTFSCTSLAEMYRDGKGVEKDPEMAKEFFGQACDKQNSLGCQQYKKMNK